MTKEGVALCAAERKKEIVSDVKTVIGKKLKLDFAKKNGFCKKEKIQTPEDRE